MLYAFAYNHYVRLCAVDLPLLALFVQPRAVHGLPAGVGDSTDLDAGQPRDPGVAEERPRLLLRRLRPVAQEHDGLLLVITKLFGHTVINTHNQAIQLIS